MSEKKELSAKYNPAEVEDKWYAWWTEHKCFHSEPNEKEPYTIVIPPPNVTGILHMGHVLNNTLNDVLIRKARMDGKNACWVRTMHPSQRKARLWPSSRVWEYPRKTLPVRSL